MLHERISEGISTALLFYSTKLLLNWTWQLFLQKPWISHLSFLMDKLFSKTGYLFLGILIYNLNNSLLSTNDCIMFYHSWTWLFVLTWPWHCDWSSWWYYIFLSFCKVCTIFSSQSSFLIFLSCQKHLQPQLDPFYDTNFVFQKTTTF